MSKKRDARAVICGELFSLRRRCLPYEAHVVQCRSIVCDSHARHLCREMLEACREDRTWIRGRRHRFPELPEELLRESQKRRAIRVRLPGVRQEVVAIDTDGMPQPV